VFRHEWAYQPIEPKILIEKLLLNDRGAIPRDYKFHMANDSCFLLEVVEGRQEDRPRRITFLNENFEVLPVRRPPLEPEANLTEPDNLEEMLNVARRLAEPFDMVRVDLYSVRGRVYFGELTHYPRSGHGTWEPQSFDFELGESWDLQPEYWKQ
jgi:hypothetical protein